MHFIFVACNKNKKLYRNDPSFIYRCENLAFGLKVLGHTTEFTHLSSFPLYHHANVVLFHRPRYSWKLLSVLLSLKYNNVLAIADIDDLVFDPQYAKYSPAVRNNILSLSKVKKQFRKNLKALKLFHYFSVSTEPLREHIDALIPLSTVLTVPNSVHASWTTKESHKASSKMKKLTYFPGTRSHDRDFESIVKPLRSFLISHPDVMLYITGTLNFHIDIPEEQLFYSEKVPFHQHQHNYENVWVNLAPLEDSVFNQCKSALKVIEAAYFNIPTICSPNPDTVRFLSSAALMAKSEDEWLEQLEKLYNSKYYNSLSKTLHTSVLELANIQQNALLFSNAVRTLAEKEKKKKNLPWINNLPAFYQYMAKKRRKQGLYDCTTLWYFRKAWLKNKKANTFVDYCMFRRDLGFILSKAKADYLHTLLPTLGRKHTKKAVSLLREVSSAQDFPYKEKRVWLQVIQKNQESWRKLFKKTVVKYQKDGICIVGNSSKLRGAKLGNKIDEHGLIIRFNHCWGNDTMHLDTGMSLDIWVTAPDYREKTEAKAKWIVVSGPDMLYREAKWERVKHAIDRGVYVLTVPLEIWKELVTVLQAPPSAGLLTLLWIKKILGDWEAVSCAGVDLTIDNNHYHHAISKHKAVKRHHWQKEKDLLQQWRNEGLKFL